MSHALFQVPLVAFSSKHLLVILLLTISKSNDSICCILAHAHLWEYRLCTTHPCQRSSIALPSFPPKGTAFWLTQFDFLVSIVWREKSCIPRHSIQRNLRGCYHALWKIGDPKSIPVMCIIMVKLNKIFEPENEFKWSHIVKQTSLQAPHHVLCSPAQAHIKTRWL